jgi:hypothetical protein
MNELKDQFTNEELSEILRITQMMLGETGAFLPGD